MDKGCGAKRLRAVIAQFGNCEKEFCKYLFGIRKGGKKYAGAYCGIYKEPCNWE